MDLDQRAMSTGHLPHSHSTPAGVDGGGGPGSRTPPPTPKKGGKMLAVRVHMLDDSITMFQVQAKAVGRVLFDQVCKQLHLLEADYFGLEYQDSTGTKYWLDLEKPLSRQVGLSLVDTLLRFCVKFYTPDPAQLEEEFTRYLFCLQIKRDLAQGSLQCNDNTAALMASYIVQAECGDYVAEDYPDHTYLSSYKFTPGQDPDLERRIMENHKKHGGQSPAEADLNLLETSRRCELYGIKMHPAKDHEGVPLNLAVAHMGILVFQNYTKINTFSWAKIRKISFKRKRFLIKLHPEGYGYYKDTVEFFFEGRNECKNFWKKCVENHGFFRCTVVKHVPRQKTRVLSRGSSFRYSGKTQKQIVEFVRENYVKRTAFQRAVPERLARSQSFRHTSGHMSHHASVTNVVGNSISAHPLLPLGDNAVIGTPASLSCGSMTLGSDRYHHHHHHQSLTAASTPTHASADIHDHAALSPTSPGPSTSMSPGTSATSSPQHFYPNRQTVEHQIHDYTNMPSPTGDISDDYTPVPAPTAVENLQYTIVPDTLGYTNIPDLNNQELHNNINNNQSNNKVSSPTSTPSAVISPTWNQNNDGEVDLRRKKYPTDKAYFIAKELLMTERTYKKDLEIINLWFREEFSKDEELGGSGGQIPVVSRLLALFNPIHESHCALLRDIETRLTTWETPRSQSCQRIGDVILEHLDSLPLYENYLLEHITILEELNEAYYSSIKFQQLYRDFELQKVCSLPLTAFILKPLQRLIHYQRILDRFIGHYTNDHPDYYDCMAARTKLSDIVNEVPDALRNAENIVQLIELQRDLAGFDHLVQPEREFIRQGCLMKYSPRKGYQQRMFFLFSDVLLYTNRITQPYHQFRVHGQLPLRGVMIEDGASSGTPSSPSPVPEQSSTGATANFSFSIYGGNRALTVAAHSQEEKDKWLEDLTAAIAQAKERTDTRLNYLSLKSCGSSDEVIDKSGTSGITDDSTTSNNNNNNNNKPATATSQRSNTTVHVCWHRSTSTGIDDHLRAVENQLSGYLLRKFKNSNGWQKLWVVFTNFCLFFYKTFQDDFPLASLPLLGYSVTTPSEKDGIQKEFVFKLQFKNHVYYFRAESEYIFGRWMDVISSATQNSKRMRLFSRQESVRNS